MSDNNVSLTPSDVVGAVQRRLQELSAYLQGPSLAINTFEARSHLEGAIDLLDALHGMQLSIQAQQSVANGNDADAETVN